MIAIIEDQGLLPLFCLHCKSPIALTSANCPMCGHRADQPLSQCDCLTCCARRIAEKVQLAKAQRPRWGMNPPRPRL